MTAYYAVVENAKLDQGDDYVRFGTARQMLAYAQAVDGDVTLYRVKKTPEFTPVEALNPVNVLDIKGTIEGAKGRVETTISELGLPKNKDEAQKTFAALKEQAIQEARETGITIAATLAMAYNLGTKDPKQLAEIAKEGGKAKADQVKGRALSFFEKARAAATSLAGEFKGTAEGKIAQAKEEFSKPAPEALVDGNDKFVRASWLLKDSNAERASTAQLLNDAKPRGVKKQPK